jgi:hypothetical protein
MWANDNTCRRMWAVMIYVGEYAQMMIYEGECDQMMIYVGECRPMICR